MPFSFTVTLKDSLGNDVGPCDTTIPQLFTSDAGANAVFNPTSENLTSTATTCSLTGQVTFNAPGTWTIVSTDSTDSSQTGSTSVVVNSTNNATHFLVSAPSSVDCGNSFSFTVQALTSSDTQANYSDTIDFSSSDPYASLPAPYTLDSAPVTFTAVLYTAGNQSITVSDGSISGSDTIDVLSSCTNNAVHFSVVAPACVTPGVQFAVTVTALNANDTVDTLYTGTVHLSSSDPLAAFSGNSQLTSGVGTFLAVLGSSGVYSITATDTVTLITGSTTVSTCQAVVPVQPITPVQPTAAPQVVQQVVVATPVPAHAVFTG